MDILTRPEPDVVDDRPEYEVFFRAHFDKVARAAALIAGDRGSGQEIAQDAFFRLYGRWDSMTSSDHARNFTYKVAVNLARSHVRKYLRLVPSGLTYADRVAAPFDESSDAWADVSAALSMLSRRQRACVVLVDLVDMDAESVAHALDINVNTVRVHVMRGRRALREALGLEPAIATASVEGDDDEG